MVFDYYHRLSGRDKAIYDRSDSVHTTKIPDPNVCAAAMLAVRDALSAERQKDTERATLTLLRNICEQLETPAPALKVLSKRPSEDWGELHGLYEPRDDYNTIGKITVWMRTAQRKQVVAPRSFLRTVIHELCHHLDYEFYALDDSFHTEGFYKRESSIYRQLSNDIDIPSAGPTQTGRKKTRNEPTVSDAEKMRRKRVTHDGPFPKDLRTRIQKKN